MTPEAMQAVRAIMSEVPKAAGGWPSCVFDARIIAILVFLDGVDASGQGVGRGVKGALVAQVRDALGIRQSRASDLLRVAANAGLVERVPTHDNRESSFALTAKGRRVRALRGGA